MLIEFIWVYQRQSWKQKVPNKEVQKEPRVRFEPEPCPLKKNLSRRLMAYEASSFTLLTTQAAGKVSHCAHNSAMCTLWIHAVKEKAVDKYMLDTYTMVPLF